MNKNYPKHTLLDTRYQPSYEDYLEYCECNDYEPQGENSNDFWGFVNEEAEIWLEDFKGNVGNNKETKTPCVILGSIGRWDGRPRIRPTFCDSLLEAVEMCWSGVDDVLVEVENGVVYVSGYHHDGTNSFEIHKLSKKGIETYERWKRNCNIPYNQDEIKDYVFAKWKGYLGA